MGQSPLLGVGVAAACFLLAAALPAAEARHRLALGAATAEIATDTTRLEPRFGPRFDATAMVTAVTDAERSYLADEGLADEFGLEGAGVLGFDEAPVGGEFIKIGVGVLGKDGDGRYRFQHAYPVARRFPLTVEADATHVTVAQVSERLNGRQYRYRKTYRPGGDGVLAIEYALTNLGDTAFTVEQYDHNFFAFAGEGGSDAYQVEADFPWGAAPIGAWRLEGRDRVRLAGPASERGDYWGFSFASPVAARAVTLRHRNGGVVAIEGDFPIVRFAVWADRKAICPETFARHTLAPGASVRWSRLYRFGVKAARGI